MREKRVPAVLVTTNKGRLVGTVTQEALERLLSSRQ
jgi:CBS domain-containing protein